MAEKIINVKYRLPYDSEKNWATADPVLLRGEVAYSADKFGYYKIGDGTSKWSELSYSHIGWGSIDGKPTTFPPSSHTHNYAGSSSAGGAANSVKSDLTIRLNGGGSGAMNLFKFNGSVAQTIDITPATIGAATSGHTHTYLTTPGDTRNDATSPNTYNNKFMFMGLKTKAAIGSPSNDGYSYVFGLRGWSESSGGHSYELAFNNTGIFARKGATTTWEAWQRILTSTNYNNFVPTKTGGGASGTWGINVTGSAGSVAWGNVSGKPSTFPPSGHNHDSAYLKRSEWNWSGQGGQPTWLWGGNDVNKYYVYNPSNFSVNYANSAGSVNGSKVRLWSDSEGGNLRLVNQSNNGYYEVDTLQNQLRMYYMSPSNVYQSCFSIDNSGFLTLSTGLRINSNRLEMYGTAPYIDFHYNNSTADFTSRIIEQASGQLKINGIIFHNNGGQMDRGGSSVNWINGHKGQGAILRQTSCNGWNPIIYAAAPNGSWTFGVYNNGGDMYLTFKDKASINSGSNSYTHRFEFIASNGGFVVDKIYGSNHFGKLGYYSHNGFLFLKAPDDGWFANCPPTDNKCAIGENGHRFTRLYAVSGSINTSDENEKHIVSSITDPYEQLFMDLKPILYRWKNFGDELRPHDRIHCGLGAQSVLTSAKKYGLDEMSFAAICRDNLETPTIDGRTERYGLAYSELHGLEIHMIQKTIHQTEELREKIIELQNDIAKLQKQLKQSA